MLHSERKGTCFKMLMFEMWFVKNFILKFTIFCYSYNCWPSMTFTSFYDSKFKNKFWSGTFIVFLIFFRGLPNTFNNSFQESTRQTVTQYIYSITKHTCRLVKLYFYKLKWWSGRFNITNDIISYELDHTVYLKRHIILFV